MVILSGTVCGDGHCPAVLLPSAAIPHFPQAGQASELLAVLGSDGSVRVYATDSLREVSSFTAAVGADDFTGALAAEPEGGALIVATERFACVRTGIPDGAVIESLTKLTADVRSIAISPSGSSAAVCGDEPNIKVVSTADSTQVILLKAQPAARLCHVSYDPKGEFLMAASFDDGKLRVYKTDSASGSSPCATINVLPKSKGVDPLPVIPVWSPDGEHIAAPSAAGGVEVLNRDSWRKEFILRSDNEEALASVVAWSPSARYVAAVVGLEIVVWDLEGEDRDAIASTSVAHPVCWLGWSKVSNSILFTTTHGKIYSWVDALPDHLAKAYIAGDQGVEDRDEDEEMSTGDEPEVGKKSKKRKKEKDDVEGSDLKDVKKKKLTKLNDEETNDKHKDVWSEDDLENELDLIELEKKKEAQREKDLKVKLEAGVFGKEPSTLAPVFKIQEPFQSGGTPELDGRRFLAWNLFGSIDSQFTETHYVIHIQFSDVSYHRPIRFNDHFGFHVAAIGPRGAVLASKNSNTANGPRSTVFFRPFNSWASNSDWRMPLEADEEAVAVAVANKAVAVVTSANLLRVMSLGGRQLFLESLPGTPITMTSDQNRIAVVHARKDGDLRFTSYNLDLKKKVTIDQSLPISLKSELRWFGYSENGLLVSIDSAGVVRAYFEAWGGSWVPVLDIRKYKKTISSRDSYWPVGVTNDSVMYAICKNGDYCPQVYPKPILSAVPLKVPLLSSESEFVAIEADHLLGDLQAKRDSTGAVTSVDAAALDKQIVKLIKIACEEDNQFRALDLCMSLNFTKSLEIAITIAKHLRQQVLAQKMNLLLKAKEAQQAQLAQLAAQAYSTSLLESTKQSFTTSQEPGQQTMDLMSSVEGSPKKGKAVKKPTAYTAPDLSKNTSSVSRPKPGSFAEKLMQKRHQ